MKKLLVVFLTTMFLSACIFQGLSFCQEDDEVLLGGGFVVKASPESITVKEISYDLDTDEQITEEVTYIVTPETETEAEGAVEDIEPGAEVGIEFIEVDGKKEAVYIEVYTEEDFE